MKKIKMCGLLMVLSLFLGLDKVNAECDNRTQLEINTASSNVTMDYSLESLTVDAEGNLHPEIAPQDVEISETSEYSLIDKVTLNINNVSDKVYVVLHGNDGDINREYHSSDLKNGSLSYKVPDTAKIRNYTLTIYSDVDSCSNQELRSIEVTTPMYNDIADQVLCENNNAYYCQRYVTTPINADDLNIGGGSESASPTPSIEEENDDRNSTIIFTLGIVIVAIMLVAIIVIVIRNKQKKDDVIRSIGGN